MVLCWVAKSGLPCSDDTTFTFGTPFLPVLDWLGDAAGEEVDPIC